MCFFFFSCLSWVGIFLGLNHTNWSLEPQIGPGLNHKIGSGTFIIFPWKNIKEQKQMAHIFVSGPDPLFLRWLEFEDVFRVSVFQKIPQPLRSTVNSGEKSEAMSVQHRMGGRYTSEPWSIGWVMEILGGQWLWAIDFFGSNMFFTIGKCWSPNF